MLRLRGGPGPSAGGEGGEGGTSDGATAEPQFEALDAIAMSGLSEHVIYTIGSNPNPNPNPKSNPGSNPNPNSTPNPNQVIYSISQPISLVAGETATIPVDTYAVRGERVLVFDPKVSKTSLTLPLTLTLTLPLPLPLPLPLLLPLLLPLRLTPLP